jgi:excisionase family DNA binding protein
MTNRCDGEAEQTTVIGPTSLAGDGPMLLPLKEAFKALGLSSSTLYRLMSQGDIEHVAIGSRKYISREAFLCFIEQLTHRGYYRAPQGLGPVPPDEQKIQLSPGYFTAQRS